MKNGGLKMRLDLSHRIETLRYRIIRWLLSFDGGGNLVSHARHELESQGLFDQGRDFYGGMTGNAVLELVELFALQGHSGMSAGLVRALFGKVAGFQPLGPAYRGRVGME